jgi:phage/plasmid-associated DNA primase
MTMTDKLFILTNDKEGNAIRTKNSYGNSEGLMRKLPSLIKTLCEDNNWIDVKQYSSLGKILFTNGYYDFKQGKFYEKGKDGFDCPEILFMNRINRSFDAFDDDDMEYIESIKKRFFHDPLGIDMGNYMALNLARGLAGDKMKRIIFGLGGTNCGKSVLTTACRLSCGEYVGNFNAENLAYRQSSNDEASIMRWAMLARFKRLLFSNELKNTTDLNGNMIKKISSGGDSIVARGHGGNETEFILHFLAIIMANDIPKIKPYDDAVNERCKVFGYNKQFVEEPSNEFELLMDKNIEKEMLTENFQRCFLGLLIKEYLQFSDNDCIENEPIEAIMSKQNWIQEEKSYINIFKNDFELSNDVDNHITSEEIQKWIDEKKLGITFTKFGMELNKYCKIHNLENIYKKDRKIQGKTRKVWVGIKSIDEVIDISS